MRCVVLNLESIFLIYLNFESSRCPFCSTRISRREDIIEKTTQDISKFDRKRAEQEVDKLLKDPEMMNFYIEFRKRLAENPNLIQPEEEEGLFSFRTLVFLYLAYVGVEVIYTNFLKDKIPLENLPFFGGGDGSAAADAVASSATAIQSTVDAAATAVGSMSFFM